MNVKLNISAAFGKNVSPLEQTSKKEKSSNITNPIVTRSNKQPTTDGFVRSENSNVVMLSSTTDGMPKGALEALNAYAAQDVTLAGPGPGMIKQGMATAIENLTHEGDLSMAQGA